VAVTCELAFVIPGRPVPKGRPRTFVRAGKARTITPDETVAYERHVATIAKVAANVARWSPDGVRYAVDLEVYLADRRRCDLDNIAKAVLDALNGIAYPDDALVDDLRVRRHIRRDEPARVRVTVLRIA
jgi:Holliday junction resolvase RusA-like endonuclease